MAEKSGIGKVFNWLGRLFLGLFEGAFGLLLFFVAEFAVVFGFMIMGFDSDVYEGTYSFIASVAVIVLILGYSFLRSVGRKKNDPFIYHDKLTLDRIVPVIIISLGIMGFVVIYFMAADFLANLFSAVKDEMDVYSETVDRYSVVAAESIPNFDHWLNFFAVSFVVPVAEELTFRGILLGELLRKVHPGVAIFISALVFGLMHGVSVQIGYALICGIFIGLIYYYTHSIWATILFHSLFNIFGSGITTLLESGMFGDQSEAVSFINFAYTFLTLLMMVPACVSFIFLAYMHKKRVQEQAAFAEINEASV